MVKKSEKKLVLSEKEIAKKAVEGIKQELVSEQIGMVRDYVKGAYRLKNSLEKQILDLTQKIARIDGAITAMVDEGDMDKLKDLDIQIGRAHV